MITESCPSAKAIFWKSHYLNMQYYLKVLLVFANTFSLCAELRKGKGKGKSMFFLSSITFCHHCIPDMIRLSKLNSKMHLITQALGPNQIALNR